jgi:hypothetical protein
MVPRQPRGSLEGQQLAEDNMPSGLRQRGDMGEAIPMNSAGPPRAASGSVPMSNNPAGGVGWRIR